MPYNPERGPEPDSENPSRVEEGVEALRGSTLSRDEIITDLQGQVDRGELTTEEAFAIAVQTGALPADPTK